MPVLDTWSDVVAAPGSRTTGTGAGQFVLTGPNWSGSLPQGVEEIRIPTNLAWICGNTYCAGAADYADVHALQRSYRLIPLSKYGSEEQYVPPEPTPDPSIDGVTAPADQVAQMDATTFFNRLTLLLKDNPPSPADAPIVERMARIGIVPGETFEPLSLNPAVRQAVNVTYEETMKIVMEQGTKSAALPLEKCCNHWHQGTVVTTVTTF